MFAATLIAIALAQAPTEYRVAYVCDDSLDPLRVTPYERLALVRSCDGLAAYAVTYFCDTHNDDAMRVSGRRLLVRACGGSVDLIFSNGLE